MHYKSYSMTDIVLHPYMIGQFVTSLNAYDLEMILNAYFLKCI